MHKASLVIPLFDKVAYTERCLASIAACTPDDLYEVIIVDNGSTDATGALLNQLDGDVTIIRNPENLGFARACNQGAEAATGEHIVFVNNDTEASPGWLEPLVAVLDREPDVGAVGAKLLFPDGTIQHAGVAVLDDPARGVVGPVHRLYRAPADAAGAGERQDVSVVTGAVMAVRRAPFFAGGGFDEGFWNGYEDVDLCYRMASEGWRIVYEPASCLVHHESASGPERFSRVRANEERLAARWDGLVVPDLLNLPNGACRPHPAKLRLTVVVSAEPDHLGVVRDCVRSIQGQLHERDELVVATGYPVEGRPFGDDPRLRVVERGYTADARSTAVAGAIGDFVLLVSGDVVLADGAVDQLLASICTIATLQMGADTVVAPVTGWAAPAQTLALHVPYGLRPSAPVSDVAAALAEAHRGASSAAGELDPSCLLVRRDSATAIAEVLGSGPVRRAPRQSFLVARSAFAARAIGVIAGARG